MRYGGPPPPDLPHTLFFGLVRMAPRFDAREALATEAGINLAFSDNLASKAKWTKMAYPYEGNGRPTAIIKQSDRDG